MIAVSHLTKYYGEHLAVDDVSFEISQGHVYGFLGPNGAGKSTTMNIITGCLSPSSGRVLIDGHDIFEQPNQAKRCIGYLPEHPPLYLAESPLEYLRFVGEAKGLRGAALNAQIGQVVARTGIQDVQNRRISSLSKGYRQRVGIAQALLGDPKVIILDEPTVGLDPIQIVEIRDLITELGRTHTVIFSSHILSEVQAICDQILMIAKGRLVAFGTPDALQKQLLSPDIITLCTDADETALRELLGGIAQCTDVTTDSAAGHTTAHVQSEHADIYALSASIFRAFAASGHVLYEMTLKRRGLEDVFMELTESAAAPQPEQADALEQAAESEVEPS